MPEQYPSRTLDKFMLRLPDGMRDRIAAEAKANGRSMNAEIVARLEASFQPVAAPSDIEERVARLEAALSMLDDEPSQVPRPKAYPRAILRELADEGFGEPTAEERSSTPRKRRR